jgi:hypothetical protein
MQLSKSDYMLFLKHPAWLWLKKHDKSKLPEIDEATQARFDAGADFEQYAERLFPGGVTVGFENYNEYLSMPSRTQKALAGGAEIIFQGRFEAKNITCITDVLNRVDDNTFDLYEVKSTTNPKPEHIDDLAFQTIVLEDAGYALRKIVVAHVDNTYVRQGDVEANKLVKFSDVTSDVRDALPQTRENIQKALTVAASPTMPDPHPRFASSGNLVEWLEVYEGLIGEFEEYCIYDLTSCNMTLVSGLEKLGIGRIVDIPDDFNLSVKQQAQVLATKRNEPIIEAHHIRDFLSSLRYPLYFLDYETASGAVPLYDGTRPYQNVPFQYSLHIVDSPGAKPVHKEYLHTDALHPGPSLLSQLKKDIGDHGSILVWSMSFEKGRNQAMGEWFPEYAGFMQRVNDRIVDLMTPFSKNWYVHKDFLGSASLKAVLPALIHDPELSYKSLVIQEGMGAQRKWMEVFLQGAQVENKDHLIADLKAYCGLDTLGMVKVYDHLRTVT